MKRILTLLTVLLSLSASGLKAAEADAPATVLTQKYAFTNFQGLSASHSFQVTLVQDDNWFVEVEYSDFLEPYLDVNVNAGTLRLGIKNLPRSVERSRAYRNGPVLRATVHMPVLTRLSLSGASSYRQEGRFSLPGTDFRMEISGASKVNNLAVSAQKARLIVSGASKCWGVEGKFTQVSLSASGASHCEVEADATDWDIVLSGSAHLNLKGAACQTLDIESSGASKADVAVASRVLQYEGSGASDLYALDGPATKAKVELSGASSCRVAVKEELDAEASGASTCRYKAVGEAPLKTHLNISRGSSIVSL